MSGPLGGFSTSAKFVTAQVKLEQRRPASLAASSRRRRAAELVVAVGGKVGFVPGGRLCC